MASFAVLEADEATESLLGSIIHSSSQFSEDGVDDKFDSAPPSPELGIGRADKDEVGDPELDKAGELDVADAGFPDVPAAEQQVDNAASESESEEPVSKLPHRRQTQQSPTKSPEPAGGHLVTPAPTCPPTRRSARAKSTLMYDQRYHPMDDIIRPSQATKRRTLHGESPVLGSGSAGEDSEESDVGSMASDKDSDDEESQQPMRGRKRKRCRSRTPEPTRRSSRRRTKPKVSYNMKIHPQDSDLKRVWACDGSKSSPSPTKHVRSNEINSSRNKTPSEDFEETCRSWFADDSEDSSPEPGAKSCQEPSAHQTALKPATKQGDGIVGTYPDLRPDAAYLAGDQDMWPALKGLPFHIFTERIEDQLHAEAEAASPFRYEDDDKENAMTNPELEPRPNPLDGISIIPASHYRRTGGRYTFSGHNSIASNAFYAHPQFEASPYGLGWSDGAYDVYNSNTNDCPVFEYMRILASSENLPRAPTSSENRRSQGDNAVACSSPARSLEGLELLR